MKNLILVLILALSPLNLLLGRADPAAQELLTKAEQLADLFHDEGNAFQLDVDFVAQIRVPTTGHLTLKWQARDRWWRKTVMGDFEEIDIRNGDRQYTSRNGSFTPVRIGELTSLLQYAHYSDSLQVKKQRQHSENGAFR